jgi:WD40 repeat protein
MQAAPSDGNLSAMIKDSQRFVLRFFDVMECSALHIYESALPLSPSSSFVRGRYLDQMSTDLKISIIDDSWDACIRAIQSHDWAYSITFSHKADLLAVGGKDIVEIFEVTTRQHRGTLTANNCVPSSAFSPDDTILVTGYDSGGVGVWDLQTGGLIGNLEGHTEWITMVAFSPCGTMIATSSQDSTVRIWNRSTLDCRSVLEGHSDFVWSICWSATGHEIVSGSEDTTVKVWSISDGHCLNTFTMNTETVWAVAFSPDSTLITSSSGYTNGTILVFDAQTGNVLHTISRNGETADVLRFLDQDQIIYATHPVFVIRDLTRGADVLTVEHNGRTPAISFDGTRVASLSERKVLKIWQTYSTQPNPDMASHHTEKVNRISFSNDGRVAASASEDSTVKYWDTYTGRCLTTFSAHAHGVRAISLSPDATVCASWATNDVIRLWDVRTGNPVSTLGNQQNGGLSRICFSPDGTILLYVLWKESRHFLVELWEVTSKDCLASMTVDSAFTEYFDASFEVDGTIIRLKLDDKTLGWRLSSSAPTICHGSSIDDDTRNLSPLPMVFVPIQDLEQLPYPRHQYHYDDNSPWVLDDQKRRILWIPPDMRYGSDSKGAKIGFGSTSGRVTFVDFVM